MSKRKPHGDMLWAPAHLLDQGETAIWWGRPNPARYLLRQNVLLCAVVMLGLAAPAGAAIVWLLEHTTGCLLLGGILFSLIVAGTFCTTLIWWAVDRRNEAKGMMYVLTDRRAVIVKPTSVVSMPYPSIKFIDLEAGSAATGNVLFLEYWVDGGEGRSLVRDGFIGIAGAEAVAREMRRLQAATS